MKSRALLPMVTALLVCGCTPILWTLRASSELDWNGNDHIELPLILDSAGHVGVPAKVQGVEVVAMLDTGASLPTINPATASAIGLRVDASVATDISVQLGSASLTFPVAPVSKGIGNTQLILGAELFSQAVVDIDFNARLVRLIDPKTFDHPKEEPVPVDLSYGRPTTEIEINGKKPAICALIDTGSFFGVSLSTKLVEKLSIPNASNRTNSYRRVSGKLIETPALAPLDEIRVGNWILDDVPAHNLGPDHNPPCGSVLGMAALSRFHPIFDIGNRKVWLLQR